MTKAFVLNLGNTSILIYSYSYIFESFSSLKFKQQAFR